MNELQDYSWYDGNTSRSVPVNIKVEASLIEPTLHFSSPPLSHPSSPPLSHLSSTSPPRSAPSSSILDQYPQTTRQRSYTSTGPPPGKRPNPYTLSRRNSAGSSTMTTVPAYAPWPAAVSKGFHTRAPMHAEHGHSMMGLNSYTSRSHDHRPTPSSSLTGAIGDSHQSSASSSSSSKGSPPYHLAASSDMDWTTSHEPQGLSSAQSYDHAGASYGTPVMTSGSPPYVSYPDHKTSSFSSNHATITSPSSFPSTSHSFPADQYAPSPRQSHSQTPYASPSSFRGSDSAEGELISLRKRVRELEMINEHARNRVKGLEAELANDTVPYATQNIPGASRRAGHSPPQSAATSMSNNFNLTWKARTDARIRLYCSLNRAGNALCAWHDSRRERRAYPPRMAPPGHLNCGCTYDEALFEESLARHGVGSYHPGESVRMDPALRNPLLRLLQDRYGYRDGDFERDQATGDWAEGEGHLLWEQRAQHGFPGPRRVARMDTDRR
ncbi:hypothetical protein BDV98DRAFT_604953 [Pterulicium gracile]|uniref:Uncharacterized protein n=1 Tax=Pterulicium gracile TaxID=1884261 RepID=A0A5C3QF89_9AGAR|nr:hypothetical protein BDV98DRAFT_604953 [Pterula gracilis]